MIDSKMKMVHLDQMKNKTQDQKYKEIKNKKIINKNEKNKISLTRNQPYMNKYQLMDIYLPLIKVSNSLQVKFKLMKIWLIKTIKILLN